MKNRYFFLAIAIFFNTSLYSTNLDELISSALNNNSIMKKSKLEIELMEEKRKNSHAKRFGEVDIVGSYTHYNLPRTLAPIVPSSLSPNSSPINTTKDLLTTGVQYSVPIFMGGALKKDVEINQIAKKLANSKMKLTSQELIYNIRSLYISALSIKEMIDAQKLYIDSLNKLQNTISVGVEVGKKAKIELLKVENSVAQAKGKLEELETSLSEIKENLSILSHQEVTYLEPIDLNQNPTPVVIDSENLDNLERFKLQNLQIDKSQKVISKVEAIKKPQVKLSSYLGYNYDATSLRDNEELWQIGVNLKWNIFDFEASKAKIQEAKIAKLQAMVNRESVTEGFKKMLNRAKSQIQKALSNYNSNLSQYNLSQESQKIEEARYDAGVATINDLLLAKSKTAIAKAKLIQSLYSYQNGLFYLDYLMERGGE